MSKKHRTKRATVSPAEPDRQAASQAKAHLPGAYSAPRTQVLAAILILAALIGIVYAPVRHFDFVEWDDPAHVTNNPHVAQGLTGDSVMWAFTSQNAGYWLPVVWLSHMLDVQLFGMNAGPHHLMNVLYHTINSLLLFGLLFRMSRAFYASACVAALFAVHPLHVESVAWVTERKDVLSTLFGLLAVWAYLDFLKNRGAIRYLFVMFLFALSLMSKPMLISLPIALLLLDVWPLKRVEIHGLQWRQWIPVVREKIPLMGLSVLFSGIAFFTQREGGGVSRLDALPLVLRLSNVAVSYLAYIRDMVWPAHLVAFYTYPQSIPLWRATGASLILLGISIFAIRSSRRYPYASMGWLWYLATLVPVIGFVQAGLQARADRFTYVPLIGLFILVVWGIQDLLARFQIPKAVVAGIGGVAILACALAARAQVQSWENTVTLWTHAVEQDPENYRAQALLGLALARRGKSGEAVPHYLEALRLRSDSEEAHNGLASALQDRGNYAEALQHYSASIRSNPNFPQAHNNLGNLLWRQGKLEQAAAEFREAIRIDPGLADAHNGLGAVLSDQGNLAGAVAEYTAALSASPNSAQAHNNLGTALAEKGDLDRAVQEFLESLRLQPDANVHVNVALILSRQGKTSEAVRHFQEALKINPNNPAVLRALEGLKTGSAAP